MKLTVFSTKEWVRTFFDQTNADYGFEIHYLETRLNRDTAPLADGADAVCIFVNDNADRAAIEVLARGGVRMIALRCAGFNNVDLAAAEEHGITVARVPAYSPHAVA